MDYQRNVRRVSTELEVVIEQVRRKAEAKEIFEEGRCNLDYCLIELFFRRMLEDVKKLQISRKLKFDKKDPQATLARNLATLVLFGRDLLQEQNDTPAAKRLVDAYNSISEGTVSYEDDKLKADKLVNWALMDFEDMNFKHSK